MSNQTYNPIQSVDGVAFNYCPSTYKYNIQDISASDSGRTEDGLMDKARVTQKVKIELEWQNIKTAEASAILKAFNPEYISVNYLDVMQGGYVTKTFYVGDRSVPSYNVYLDVWENVAFDIVER